MSSLNNAAAMLMQMSSSRSFAICAPDLSAYSRHLCLGRVVPCVPSVIHGPAKKVYYKELFRSCCENSSPMYVRMSTDFYELQMRLFLFRLNQLYQADARMGRRLRITLEMRTLACWVLGYNVFSWTHTQLYDHLIELCDGLVARTPFDIPFELIEKLVHRRLCASNAFHK